MSELLKGSLATWHLRENIFESWLKANKPKDMPIDGSFKFWVDKSGIVIGKYKRLESWSGILAYFEMLNKVGEIDYSDRVLKVKEIINSLKNGKA